MENNTYTGNNEAEVIESVIANWALMRGVDKELSVCDTTALVCALLDANIHYAGKRDTVASEEEEKTVDEEEEHEELDFNSPYGRLVVEKRELDKRIMRLTAFIDSYLDDMGEVDIDALALKVGSVDMANAMLEQLNLEIELSGVLNRRILLWRCR